MLLLSLMISCGSNSQIFISATPTSGATRTPTDPGAITPIMTFTATPVPATPTQTPTGISTVTPIATSTATPVPAPVINSIRDSNGGDNKDSENGSSEVSFSVFGSHLSGTGVKVTFTDVDSGTVYTGTVDSSTDGELEGTINIPGGKYVIEVTVGGKTSTDVVYFYKGTGTYGKS
ncbi:MAG: hypothetical protein ABRQ37_03995 [Candidatus Eremiobacterota bacterium]